MTSISLYDIYGRLLENIGINAEVYDLDMKHYGKGLYILRIITSGKIITTKIIRN